MRVRHANAFLIRNMRNKLIKVLKNCYYETDPVHASIDKFFDRNASLQVLVDTDPWKEEQSWWKDHFDDEKTPEKQDQSKQTNSSASFQSPSAAAVKQHEAAAACMVSSAVATETVESPAPCIHNDVQQMRARSPGTEVYDILQDDLGEDGDCGREKGGREPGATAAAAVTELTEEHRVPPISYRQAVSWIGSGKWREALLEPPSPGIVQELPDTELFKVFDWMNSKPEGYTQDIIQRQQKFIRIFSEWMEREHEQNTQMALQLAQQLAKAQGEDAKRRCLKSLLDSTNAIRKSLIRSGAAASVVMVSEGAARPAAGSSSSPAPTEFSAANRSVSLQSPPPAAVDMHEAACIHDVAQQIQGIPESKPSKQRKDLKFNQVLIRLSLPNLSTQNTFVKGEPEPLLNKDIPLQDDARRAEFHEQVKTVLTTKFSKTASFYQVSRFSLQQSTWTMNVRLKLSCDQQSRNMRKNYIKGPILECCRKVFGQETHYYFQLFQAFSEHATVRISEDTNLSWTDGTWWRDEEALDELDQGAKQPDAGPRSRQAVTFPAQGASMPSFRSALLSGERATVAAAPSIGEEESNAVHARSHHCRRGLSSRKDGDDDSKQERGIGGKSSCSPGGAKRMRVESVVAASALGSSNGWTMHCSVSIPRRLLHTTHREQTAIKILRSSICTWVKRRGEAGILEARYLAPNRTLQGEGVLECIIHGIDQTMATNQRQFQSHLENRLKAVLQDNLRENKLFRNAPLKFKNYKFKVQSEEFVLHRLQARQSSQAGFQRWCSANPHSRADQPAVTEKAPAPAKTGPRNVPALREMVKSVNETVDTLSKKFETIADPQGAMIAFAECLTALRFVQSYLQQLENIAIGLVEGACPCPPSSATPGHAWPLHTWHTHFLSSS